MDCRRFQFEASRQLLLFALSIFASLLSGGPAFCQAAEEEKNVHLQRSQIISRGARYEPPDRISRRAAPATKVVTVDLNVEFAQVQVDCPVPGGPIERHTLRVRTYNGKMTTPEIRVSPGDLLRLRLFNRIDRTEPDKPFAANKPNGFNITNLHTHGLHVSPEGRSDNVYLEVGPEEGIGLCFDIPPNHRPGTHWFHAHRHGSTALQLSSGMVGALIVDPGSNPSFDDVDEIKKATEDGREKILVFQQLKYSIDPATNIGEVTEKDVYDNPTPQHRVTLINGTYAPLIEMRPGEVQRWRCIHGGIDSELQLQIVNVAGNDPWDLNEIAVDGLPLYEINRTRSVLLYPGYRSDFLVQAPTAEGEYLLTNKRVLPEQAFRKVAVSDAGAFRRIPLGDETFAHVRVKGAPLTMELPKTGVIGKYAIPEIKDAELFNRLPCELKFAVDAQQATINDQVFDPAREGVCPRIGTAEEWTLISENDKHPFHIHVNPFMVVTKDASGQVISRLWKDTLLVNADVNPREFVRMRFEDFTGKTVLHCHNLEHEDHGMMMAVRIVGKPGLTSRCDEKQLLPSVLTSTRAPNWSLPDSGGTFHRLADLHGQRHLLIFYRGMGCSHCRRQLELLAQHLPALDEAKLKVVAISPDTSESMARALTDEEAVRSLPFLLLSDPTRDAFKRYGCFDGRSLHGTFLVDADGIVQWQDVGDEPYIDIERLLSQCRRIEQSQRP